MIPTFIRAYEASADIGAYLIVAFSDAANSQKIALASANTDPLVGTSDALGGVTGAMVDTMRAGLGKVTLGGTVAAGDPLTSDADGKAIVAAVAAATNVSILGYADEPGVAGDVIDYWHARGVLTKPAAT